MLCDECQKNLATVHLTKIVNDSMSKMHLCEDCAGRLSVTVAGNPLMTFPQILAGLFDLESASPAPPLDGELLQCPRCGSSFNDLRETGKLGCAGCYEAFEEHIDLVLRRIHGSSEHRGKVPAGAASMVKVKVELRELRGQLQELVSAEKFEEAAQTRDRIRKLEKLESVD